MFWVTSDGFSTPHDCPHLPEFNISRNFVKPRSPLPHAFKPALDLNEWLKAVKSDGCSSRLSSLPEFQPGLFTHIGDGFSGTFPSIRFFKFLPDFDSGNQAGRSIAGFFDCPPCRSSVSVLKHSISTDHLSHFFSFLLAL